MNTLINLLNYGQSYWLDNLTREKFGFATLHRARALGDFRSLADKGRRVIRIHLGKDVDAGLNGLYQSVRVTQTHTIGEEVL